MDGVGKIDPPPKKNGAVVVHTVDRRYPAPVDR